MSNHLIYLAHISIGSCTCVLTVSAALNAVCFAICKYGRRLDPEYSEPFLLGNRVVGLENFSNTSQPRTIPLYNHCYPWFFFWGFFFGFFFLLIVSPFTVMIACLKKCHYTGGTVGFVLPNNKKTNQNRWWESQSESGIEIVWWFRGGHE